MPMPLLLILFFTSFALGGNLLSGFSKKNNELIVLFSHALKKSNIKHFTLENPHREIFDIADAKLRSGTYSKARAYGVVVAQRSKSKIRLVVKGRVDWHIPLLEPNCLYLSPKNKGRYWYASKKSSSRYFYKKTKKSDTLASRPQKAIDKKSSKPKRPTVSKEPKRLVVAKVSKPSKTLRSSPSPKAHHTKASKPHKVANKKSHSQTKTDQRPPKLSLGRKLVVIDPGHGGHDAGAIAGSFYEKRLVLSIAKKIKKYLLGYGLRVKMTRQSDRYLKLKERTRFADRYNADVFVSVHANSLPKSKRDRIYGIETFYLSRARDAKSEAVAKRENSELLKGVGGRRNKDNIADSVFNGPKVMESGKLAIDIHKSMLGGLKHHYSGIRDGGVRGAPFWVLVGASRPSVLIEVGYISNSFERKRLFNRRYQERIAKGIAQGIVNYLKKRKRELGI